MKTVKTKYIIDSLKNLLLSFALINLYFPLLTFTQSTRTIHTLKSYVSFYNYANNIYIFNSVSVTMLCMCVCVCVFNYSCTINLHSLHSERCTCDEFGQSFVEPFEGRRHVALHFIIIYMLYLCVYV